MRIKIAYTIGLALVAGASAVLGSRYAARQSARYEDEWSDLWMERGDWLDRAYRADKAAEAGDRPEWNAGFAEGMREASDGFLSIADPGEAILRLSEREREERGYLGTAKWRQWHGDGTCCIRALQGESAPL